MVQCRVQDKKIPRSPYHRRARHRAVGSLFGNIAVIGRLVYCNIAVEAVFFEGGYIFVPALVEVGLAGDEFELHRIDVIGKRLKAFYAVQLVLGELDLRITRNAYVIQRVAVGLLFLCELIRGGSGDVVAIEAGDEGLAAGDDGKAL